eukprot:6490472-Amphidinium_carterae.1
MAPVAMPVKTAFSMLKAIETKFPMGLQRVLMSGKFACLVVSADSARANEKVIKHLLAKVPEDKFFIFSRCLQHQVGLILGGLALEAGFVPSMFCAAKSLQNGQHLEKIETTLRELLHERLVIHHTSPHPQDLARTEALVHVCLPSTSSENGIKDAESFMLMRIWNGNITSKKPVHCCVGCCSSRNETIDNAVSSVMAILSNRVCIPAVNRWISVYPVVAVHALLIGIHSLWPQIELRLRGGNVEDEDEEALLDAEAQEESCPQSLAHTTSFQFLSRSNFNLQQP